MAEYIERKALIEKIVNTPTVPIKQCYEGNFVYADGTASRQNEIINYITEQPTADVVEVVRCKECKYFLHDTDYCKKHNAGYCEFDNQIKARLHFCGLAIKKEGAEEWLK